MKSPSDAEVLGRSLGDPEAFAAIFDRHAETVFRYLVRRVGRTTAGGTGRLLAATHGRGVWELYVGNDDCADAVTITDGNYAGTTLGATADGASSCLGDSGAPSVWYEYVATCDGQLRADTCGSSFDTLVSIHSECAMSPRRTRARRSPTVRVRVRSRSSSSPKR